MLTQNVPPHCENGETGRQLSTTHLGLHVSVAPL